MVLVEACSPEMKVTVVVIDDTIPCNVFDEIEKVVNEVESEISIDIFWIVKRISIRSRLIDMQRCNKYIRSPTIYTILMR
jgi:hypothetical protein